MLEERVEIKHKSVIGLMLVLILVGVLNVPLTVTEVGVGNPENQILNGDDLEPFSVAEDPWNFSNRIEWSRFAYFNDNSAEVVIGLRNTQTRSHAKLSSLTHKSCGEIVNTVSMGGEVRAVVAEIPLARVSSFVTEMQATGLSTYIEPNIKFQAIFVPNDPYWPQQWGPRIIKANYAWNNTIGDPSVLVAVIDTGIDYNHPDLAGNYVALGYDWMNNDTDPMDDHGHGTHCAGIIAATLNNSLGIAGVAQVQIMAEKGLDSGGSGKASDLANAIIHAVDQGADILSNSWGGYSYSNLIHDSVKYAQDHGVLVVAAAGNEASNMRHYPAAYDEVVSVTATDQSDALASFTSYGKWVDVAAPGVDIYSTISETHDPRFSYPYDYLSGTSMACPHAVGVAALIWSEFPSLKLDEVRLRLRLTADDLGDAGFDVYYGYGRVNARRAVEPLSSHDLLILDWKRPAYVEPGSSAIINTTVVNFGSSNEAGITVQLLANGSTVDSAYISYLGSVKSATVSCTWSPTVEGSYHVESYVVPVSGETAVENNVRSAYINMRVGKYIRVPEDCSKIQEAVDLASPGETIKVASGRYYESVSIDTSLKLVGENRNTTVIDCNGTGTVVGVTADNVEVRGFTVQNSTGGLPSGGGVVLLGVKNCEVTRNTVINNFEGVTLWGCTGNNSVYDNIAFSNEDANIGSFLSTGRDTISDNAITGGVIGVVIVLDPADPSGYNRENTVSRNLITKSKYGISIVADDNTVVNNTITLCSDRGVWLSHSGNTIRDNRVENNQRGIVMDGLASSNRIYHNDFIHNTIQTSLETFSQNTWDDGYPSGGNHWSDYNGVDLYSGPYPNLTSGDGLGDTPYIINENNADNYPLMHPLVTPFYHPTAKFTYAPKPPSVYIAVTFNASASASGWNGTVRVPIANYTWDFGDENVTTVANPLIRHNYPTNGTYTVNLTVTCQDDSVLVAEGLMSDSTWQDITIVSPYSPTANFVYWLPISYMGDMVTFYASDSLPGWNGTHDVPVANYTWDFGDGNTTATTNPIIGHTYAHNRTYTVNLTVKCQDDPVLIAKGLTSGSTWQNITIGIESPPLPRFTTVLFEDDFESYDVGTFPYAGGWELWKHGEGYESRWIELLPHLKIKNNTPTKSLQLAGQYFPIPSPVAAKRINTDAPVIGFEVWVRINKFSGGGQAEHTQVGFTKKTSPTTVEWCAKVSFNAGNHIRMGDHALQSYSQNRWYKVRMVLDRSAGIFYVWINDVLKGINIVSVDPYEIEAFGLTQCLWRETSYFDEVKIFEGEEEPQGPSSFTAEFDFWPYSDNRIPYVNDTVVFSSQVEYDPALGWTSTPYHDFSIQYGYYAKFRPTDYVNARTWKAFATPVSSGNITVVWRAKNAYTSPYSPHQIFSVLDTTGGYIVGFLHSGYIAWYCNGTYHNIQAYYANTWYKFELRISLDQRKYSIYINNVLKVSEADAHRAPLQAKYFVLDTWSTDGYLSSAYIKSITVTTPSGTTVFAEDFKYEEAPIISYEWDFGDGSISEGMTVNHTYTTFGTYDVTLTVTNTKGVTVKTWKTVTARNYPVAFFTYTPDRPYAGYPVTFNASLPTPNGAVISRYEWSFGDRNTANMTIPTAMHIYATPGTYNVTLTVRDSEGHNDMTWGTITITILGDINGDRVVDSTDQGILGMAWGSTVGGPNYIPEADLNDDGVVDSTDLGILGVNWGHSWL